MISNGMWYILSLPYPHNQENKQDILLHHSWFPLDYVYLNLKSLQKVSEIGQYAVQNLTWLIVYPRITLSNALPHKVLTMVPLKETGPGGYFATMNTFMYDSYDALEDKNTHLKIIKLNRYTSYKITYSCATILVDAKHLENDKIFKYEHIGYINCIFEDTSYSIFHLW